MQICRRDRNDLCWCYCHHRSPIGSRLCRSNAQVVPSPRGNRVPEGVSSAGGAEPSRISQGRCSMLELLASKGARAVLRGGGTGDSASLPDRLGGRQRWLTSGTNHFFGLTTV